MTDAQHRNPPPLELEKLSHVLTQPADERCIVSPSPELADRIKAETARLNTLDRVKKLGGNAVLTHPRHPGLNDGLIIPGSHFPLGTPIAKVRSAAADRAPLHGTLRIIVVLVDFDDQPMTETVAHFEDLFFSNGVLANGSVREYFDEVTNGLVDLTGEVLGPYRMPRDLTEYANGNSGTGSAFPNARTMARDAAAAADPETAFGPYDNDGDGFVDAFIVVHAGGGAEQSGSLDEIWSHKWVLPSVYTTEDGTRIYAYLTVPENARIGVCAHELGHLLFGLPDLYDIDQTSAGIGNWCLMAGGSWGGGGNTPTHPSAWCKAQQQWVTVSNVTASATLSIADVKDAHTVYRLWKDGGPGQEYFLVENRQADRRDVSLPGSGLLIWHIDDAVANNSDETHYRVALEQADGAFDLENNTNRGDGGDCYPGTADNRAFTASSTPNSRSYGGIDTCVRVTEISDPGPVMTAEVQVTCGKAPIKDIKDAKDGVKERKDFKEKDFREKDLKEKEQIKDFKEKELKENKELKDKEFKEKEQIKDFKEKEFKEDKEIKEKEFKENKEIYEDKLTDNKLLDDKFTDNKLTDNKLTDNKLTDGKPGEGGFGGGRLTELEQRLAAIEATLAGRGEATSSRTPFIRRELRPDLEQSALSGEPDGGNPSGPVDKRVFDTPQGRP